MNNNLTVVVEEAEDSFNDCEEEEKEESKHMQLRRTQFKEVTSSNMLRGFEPSLDYIRIKESRNVEALKAFQLNAGANKMNKENKVHQILDLELADYRAKELTKEQLKLRDEKAKEMMDLGLIHQNADHDEYGEEVYN